MPAMLVMGASQRGCCEDEDGAVVKAPPPPLRVPIFLRSCTMRFIVSDTLKTTATMALLRRACSSLAASRSAATPSDVLGPLTMQQRRVSDDALLGRLQQLAHADKALLQHRHFRLVPDREGRRVAVVVVRLLVVMTDRHCRCPCCCCC
jgi:hypothetical protein